MRTKLLLTFALAAHLAIGMPLLRIFTQLPVVSSFVNPNSATCDGSTTYITLGNNFDNSSTSPQSWSFWMNPASITTSTQRIISKFDASGAIGWSIIQTLSELKLQFSDGSGQLNVNTVGAGLTVGTWYFVFVTYNGNQLPSGVTIYVNNVSQTLTPIINTLSGSTSNGGLAQFCTVIQGADGQFYNGLLNQAAFYNSVIPSGTVSTLYNSGTPKDITGTSGLQSWYRFATSGVTPVDTTSTIYDRIGSANGTVNGTFSFSTNVP